VKQINGIFHCYYLIVRHSIAITHGMLVPLTRSTSSSVLSRRIFRTVVIIWAARE
jgi:hypothetical protein